MQSNSTDWADLTLKLQDGLWADLAGNSWSDVSLARTAEDLLIDPVYAQLAAVDKTELVLHKLASLDRDALASTHAEIADDPDASMHDKLLEGLIHRFEVYQPFKAQIRHLHGASYRDPALGLKLISRLTSSMDALLMICGDSEPSIQRKMRVKGLTGVAMSVRTDWLADDTADLAKTTKLLDNRLKQAAEWAESFRLI